MRHLIDGIFDRLEPAEKAVLEAASVAGIEFHALEASIATNVNPADTEQYCDSLTSRHLFLRPAATVQLPNGAPSPRYGFRHCPYREGIYARIPPGRRMRLHERVGDWLESVYRGRTGEVAAELSIHFERAADFRRAVRYRQLAAENASRRYANTEAFAHLSHALALVNRISGPDAIALESGVWEQIGTLRRSTSDMAGAVQAFERLVECTGKLHRDDLRVKALTLLTSALHWVDRERSITVAEEALERSRNVNDRVIRLLARANYSNFGRSRGWDQAHPEAIPQLVKALRRSGDHARLAVALASDALVAILRSQYSEAIGKAREAQELCLESGDAHYHLSTQFFEGMALLYLGHWGVLEERAHVGFQLATRNGHWLGKQLFQVLLAWLHQEARAFPQAGKICDTILAEAPGAGLQHLLVRMLLAGVHVGQGRHDIALSCMSEIQRAVKERCLHLAWFEHIFFRYWLAECRLARGEYELASREAVVACELAATCGERMWLALGHRLHALILIATGRMRAAGEALSRAVQIIDDVETPLAAWRVFAAMANWLDRCGNAAEAIIHWRSSAAVIERLAGSLAETHPLRSSFLNAPEVNAILIRANACPDSTPPRKSTRSRLHAAGSPD